MVSTHMETGISRRANITSISSGHSNSTGLLLFCTEWAQGDTIPGFIYTTANTYINVPVKEPGGDMSFVIIYDGPSTSSTTYSYPAVSIQKRMSTQGGFNGSTHNSTAEGAFERIYSTAYFNASSTEAQTFLLGPIDTMKYGLIEDSTTGERVSKNEMYVRMMVGYSTAATCTHDALSTNAPVGSYYVLPIQFGSKASTGFT